MQMFILFTLCILSKMIFSVLNIFMQMFNVSTLYIYVKFQMPIISTIALFIFSEAISLSEESPVMKFQSQAADWAIQ